MAFLLVSSARAQEPTYISSLADYQVRHLSGVYAPSNGKTTLESITPAEWLYNDPGTGGLLAVLNAWTGGAKGAGTKLFVHGGGHSDGANNGLHVFEFSGAAKPTGWLTPVVRSAVASVVANADQYSDGLPTSIHTYDGMVYAHHNNHVYRVVGARYGDGWATKGTWKFNVASSTWTRLANYPGPAYTVHTIYDPVSRKILVLDTNVGYFFNTTSETWSAPKSLGVGLRHSSVGAWDTVRGRGIIAGHGDAYLANVDFAAETVSISTLSPSGSTGILSSQGISVVYDEGLDVYWIWGGPTGSSGWSNIYEMKADTWQIIAHALTGDPIVQMSGMWGSYGRFVWMPQWRAIGTIADIDTGAYVIKLPVANTQPVAPPTPTGVVAF